jgi:23S rRNA pseudouridine1911/1915/1917 synthase
MRLDVELADGLRDAECDEPKLIYEDDDYLALYKPARMHSDRLMHGDDNTLAAWAGEHFSGMQLFLLHRLDFETRGLVLFAKSSDARCAAEAAQADGRFVKEYAAKAVAEARLSAPQQAANGWPPSPAFDPGSAQCPFVVESAFRPFGPGGREVRPVVQAALGKRALHSRKYRASGRVYRTIIEGIEARSTHDGLYRLRLSLEKGARHQLRCHLAWLGLPIIGDPLYGGEPGTRLELCAVHLLLATEHTEGHGKGA